MLVLIWIQTVWLLKFFFFKKEDLGRRMRFPIMWYVRPAKPQINLRIRAVWSEPLLVACISYECWATDWTLFWVSKFKRRLHRLAWVYTCQNTTLLEITSWGDTNKQTNILRLIWKKSADIKKKAWKIRQHAKELHTSKASVLHYLPVLFLGSNRYPINRMNIFILNPWTHLMSPHIYAAHN